MTPAEDARLLQRLVEHHLGSLRGTLDRAVFADEDWGFLAQQTLEKALKALLVIRNQELEACGESVQLATEPLELDDLAVLARYDLAPTPLPAERGPLLQMLEDVQADLQRRLPCGVPTVQTAIAGLITTRAHQR